MSAPGHHLPMVQSPCSRGAVEGRPAVHLQPLNAVSTGKQESALSHGKTMYCQMKLKSPVARLPQERSCAQLKVWDHWTVMPCQPKKLPQEEVGPRGVSEHFTLKEAFGQPSQSDIIANLAQAHPV